VGRPERTRKTFTRGADAWFHGATQRVRAYADMQKGPEAKDFRASMGVHLLPGMTSALLTAGNRQKQSWTCSAQSQAAVSRPSADCPFPNFSQVLLRSAPLNHTIFSFLLYNVSAFCQSRICLIQKICYICYKTRQNAV
jgi:hypothetical protein